MTESGLTFVISTPDHKTHVYCMRLIPSVGHQLFALQRTNVEIRHSILFTMYHGNMPDLKSKRPVTLS